MSSSVRKIIKFDQGWDILQKGIAKHIRILEELPEQPFTSEENMLLYTTIHNMCTQRPPYDYSQQLYDNCREAFKAYITSTVLPALREKHDEFMLRELLKRWINHKVMVKWFSRTFDYLDRYFIVLKSLPGLHEVGLACFHDLICMEEINGKIKDVVISLIDQEREGEQIDRALLKNILDIFMEIGVGQMKYSCPDYMLKIDQEREGEQIDRALLKNILDIIMEIGVGQMKYSCPDYMLKAEDCLKKEKDRVEEVQHQLANQLLEKENSRCESCDALLRDDKELGLHEQSL